MTQGTGFPIRLVKSNKDRIPLMAESLVMSVDRTVGAVPIPFSNNTRMGMDLNMATAAIVIEGVFADDSPVETIHIPERAKASINFNYNIFGNLWWDGGPNNMANLDGTLRSIGELRGSNRVWATTGKPYFFQVYSFKDKDNFIHRIALVAGIDFSNAAADWSDGSGNANDDLIGSAVMDFPNGYSWSDDYVFVGIRGATSIAQITTKMATALNQTACPSSITPRPGNYFQASTADETALLAQGVGGILNIEHLNAGGWGGGTPLWFGVAHNATTDQYGMLSSPRISLFTGGGGQTYQARTYTSQGFNDEMSAGDKAYELWALCNNMNNDTDDIDPAVSALQSVIYRANNAMGDAVDEVTTGLTNMIDWVAKPLMTIGFGVAAAGVDVIGSVAEEMQPTTGSSHYIEGIQIPYQSMVTAQSGQKYTQRNFLSPTGGVGSGATQMHQLKHAAANLQSADRVSMAGDRFGMHTTHIKGTIKQFIINHDAGESVYRWQMTFIPIDFII